MGQATGHYLNQWWSRLLTHICVTRPQNKYRIQQKYLLRAFLHDVARHVRGNPAVIFWKVFDNGMSIWIKDHKICNSWITEHIPGIRHKRVRCPGNLLEFQNLYAKQMTWQAVASTFHDQLLEERTQILTLILVWILATWWCSYVLPWCIN